MITDLQTALSRLRDELTAQMPERIAALHALLDAASRGEPDSFESLRLATHNLADTARTHGLTKLAELARELEKITASSTGDTLHVLCAGLAAKTAHQAYLSIPPPVNSTMPRILVVGNDAQHTDWLRCVLEDEGYQVEIFSELAALHTALQSDMLPAAFIMDMVFPEGGEAGARAIADLKLPEYAALPVIFLSVRHDMAARLAAHRAGATRYLTKPVDPAALLQMISASASPAPKQAYRILIVDDSASELAAHALMLRKASLEVREALNPLEVLDMLDDFAAEVLLLDMHMPECTGPELAAILHDEQRYAAIPIVYLSAETDVSRSLSDLSCNSLITLMCV